MKSRGGARGVQISGVMFVHGENKIVLTNFVMTELYQSVPADSIA